MAVTISEYYRELFPDGVRLSMKNPNSLVYKCDVARLEALEWLYGVIIELANQFQILTATTALDDYEQFLGIPYDSTLTVSERRARILIKFAGYPATIENIKLIAKEITGVEISINEYGLPTDPLYDANKCWKVLVTVDYNLPGIKEFKTSYFERIMKQVFPAHTEWEADSFLYIAPYSYLAPVTPSTRQPLILDEQYLRYQP